MGQSLTDLESGPVLTPGSWRLLDLRRVVPVGVLPKMRRPRSSRRRRPFLSSLHSVPAFLAVSLALLLCLVSVLLLACCLACHPHRPCHSFTKLVASVVLQLPNMMRDLFPAGFLSLLLSSLAGPAPAAATVLFASSYSGAITTLNFTLSGNNGTQSTLQNISTSNGCAPSPSWLTLDKPNAKLYCTDEGLTTDHGTVSSFTTGPDGKLEQLSKVDTISGPVSAVLFGEKGAGLAVAQ